MQMLPNMDMVRFVSSGTEACMSALRLARGYTGREKSLNLMAVITAMQICYLCKQVLV